MTIKEYRLPLGLRIRRVIAKRIIRLVFQTAGRVKVTGVDNIPRGKPYVAAINHISIYDPPLVLALWPEMLEAVGAVDVFDKPFQGDLLRIYGVIPVHRGQYDRELIDIMLAILRAGHPLMIAPEGTRSHGSGLQQAKSGVGYILAQANVPVLPIGIVGTADDLMKKALHFHRPSVEVRIGRPFSVPPIEGTGPARRLARQRDADLVMQHIAGLLPPEYRGIYAASAIQP
ncbi:MAG: lysophospholipid acyltransferase family protein [Anaerolineales bacterium]